MILPAALAAAAEGLAVGAGLAALIVVLSVGVRLASLAGTLHWAGAYQWALVLGAVAAAAYEVHPYHLRGGAVLAGVLGLGMGLFIGLLAAGLAETVAALPVLGRILGLRDFLPRLVLAFALGKLLGAVLWLAVPSLFSRPPT